MDSLPAETAAPEDRKDVTTQKEPECPTATTSDATAFIPQASHSGSEISKHFSTIGIEDVFLEGPSHPLPSVYLANDSEKRNGPTEPSSLPTSFWSWETVGTLKLTPEDFVVREVFSPHRSIPGLSQEDRSKLAVARFIRSEELPIQRLEDEKKKETSVPKSVNPNNPPQSIGDEKEMVAAAKTSLTVDRMDEDEKDGKKEDGSNEIKERKENIHSWTKELNEKVNEDDNLHCKPTETHSFVLQSYLKQVAPTSPNDADSLRMALQELEGLAARRIKSKAELGHSLANNDNNNHADDKGKSVWIPSLQVTAEEKNQDDEASLSLERRRARGQFHQALKAEHPLLIASSKRKEAGGDPWIEVQIDQSYDALVPFLENPLADLRALLTFCKEGPATEKHPSDSSTSKECPSPEVLLKLKATVNKEQRKEIHRILSLGSKSLETSTITNVADPSNPTTATIIRVGWWTRNRGNNGRGRKRKRPDKASSSDTKSSNPFPNVLTVLKKRQKEHLTALQKLQKFLKCRPTDIGIAGIKDMQAVTYQFVTIRNTSVQRIQSSAKQLPRFGMELSNCYLVDWVLNQGDLSGNNFEIVLRQVKRIQVEYSKEGGAREVMKPCTPDHLQEMVERLRRNGFINFFGEQRVGAPGRPEEVGVRAFDIGRAMLQQNYGKAVDLMIQGRKDSRESKAAQSCRQTWKDSGGDPSATLKALKGADPNVLSRERIVLKGLVRFGKDRPLEALRSLSYSMRTFWINAYQSYIWNQVASARIQLYGTKVVPGDLYRIDDKQEVQIVKEDPGGVLPKITQLVLPLPGHNVTYPTNEMSRLYERLLREDSIQFLKTAPLESRAKGSYRRLVVLPSDLKSEMVDETSLRLNFFLPKGSYATMLFRELMLTTTGRTR